MNTLSFYCSLIIVICRPFFIDYDIFHSNSFITLRFRPLIISVPIKSIGNFPRRPITATILIIVICRPSSTYRLRYISFPFFYNSSIQTTNYFGPDREHRDFSATTRHGYNIDHCHLPSFIYSLITTYFIPILL
jgi:hypothetical protein